MNANAKSIVQNAVRNTGESAHEKPERTIVSAAIKKTGIETGAVGRWVTPNENEPQK